MAKILLADDDASLRQFLCAALERAGHDVIAFGDGMSAMAALENSVSKFDLLLTDIVMPGMDGIELSSRAVRIHPGLKVLFITGFSAVERGDLVTGDASEPEKGKVISKPFHLGQLVQQIEELMAG